MCGGCTPVTPALEEAEAGELQGVQENHVELE